MLLLLLLNIVLGILFCFGCGRVRYIGEFLWKKASPDFLGGGGGGCKGGKKVRRPSEGWGWGSEEEEEGGGHLKARHWVWQMKTRGFHADAYKLRNNIKENGETWRPGQSRCCMHSQCTWVNTRDLAFFSPFPLFFCVCVYISVCTCRYSQTPIRTPFPKPRYSTPENVYTVYSQTCLRGPLVGPMISGLNSHGVP